MYIYLKERNKRENKRNDLKAKSQNVQKEKRVATNLFYDIFDILSIIICTYKIQSL